MAHSARTVASCNVQRSLQKTSGLFNNDLTDVAESVTSVGQEDVAMVTDKQAAQFSDVLNLLEKDQESLVDLGLEPSLDLDLGDQNFLEGFMDLSEFLGTEAIETSADDETFLPTFSTSAIAPPVVITSNHKRKIIEPTPTTSASPQIIPSDHNGYISKRSRINTNNSVSDTDSEFGSTSSSSNAVSKADKYIERRRKNNVASRRSRETRKQKFVSMEDKATELEIANAELRQKVTLLEELAKEMKETLIKRLASK